MLAELAIEPGVQVADIGAGGSYFEKLQIDLSPAGRIAILELRGTSWFSRNFGHFTDRETIVAEHREAGYEEIASHDFIEPQTFTIFRRKQSRE